MSTEPIRKFVRQDRPCIFPIRVPVQGIICVFHRDAAQDELFSLFHLRVMIVYDILQIRLNRIVMIYFRPLYAVAEKGEFPLNKNLLTSVEGLVIIENPPIKLRDFPVIDNYVRCQLFYFRIIRMVRIHREFRFSVYVVSCLKVRIPYRKNFHFRIMQSVILSIYESFYDVH